MEKAKWKKKIIKQCQDLGTYQDAYIPAIETLAGILEFTKSGGKSVVEYVNKFGAVNMVKNPLLTLWDDLNASALMYWRDLGLTPSSYKKMTGGTPKTERGGGLAEAIKSLDL